jgi:hypothetical protein
VLEAVVELQVLDLRVVEDREAHVWRAGSGFGGGGDPVPWSPARTFGSRMKMGLPLETWPKK